MQNNSPRRLSCSVCAVKLKLVFKGTLPVSIKGAQKKATLGRSSCPVSPDSGTIFFSNAVARLNSFLPYSSLFFTKFGRFGVSSSREKLPVAG